MEELELLMELLHYVCGSEVHERTKGLNFWCKEKTLDNIPWNIYHLEQINSQNGAQATGHMQSIEDKEEELGTRL